MKAFPKPVLEVAVLDIRPAEEKAFERDIATASRLIASAEGYISHQLRRCIEKKGRYILLVEWTSLEAHTEGFRKSPAYLEWRKLLHHYYDPFPVVEHYSSVL